MQICRMPVPLLAAFAVPASPFPPGRETGIFDLPEPLFRALDGFLASVPAPIRVVLWSALAGFVSMLLYRLLSRQERLAELEREMGALRIRLQGFEGEFGELWPLLRHNLALSGRRLAATFLPAMVAGLPVLFTLAFLASRFDARLPPPGEEIELRLVAVEGRMLPRITFEGGEVKRLAPDRFRLRWPPPERPLLLRDDTGEVLLRLPLASPVRTIARRQWWNLFFGSPVGYLPQEGAIEAVEIDLPRLEILPFGPDWMRGWLAVSLFVVVVVSLGLKFWWRLR